MSDGEQANFPVDGMEGTEPELEAAARELIAARIEHDAVKARLGNFKDEFKTHLRATEDFKEHGKGTRKVAGVTFTLKDRSVLTVSGTADSE